MDRQKTALCLATFTLACLTGTPSTYGADTEATLLLKERSKALQPTITRVADSVYCATGYSPANVTMIVGKDGVVIVDAGMLPAHTEKILADFRKVSKLPLAGVILTHGHGDHTGGLSVLMAEGTKDKPIPVYARGPFNTEGNHFNDAAVTINKRRGARQGGFLLPPDKRINNGIAPAIYPPKDRNVFLGAKAGPNQTFSEHRKTITLAGITLDLVAAPGETSDQLYVWFPAEKVVFTGDNFYRSWPNLYAIRGTGYRDVQAWVKSLDMMLAEKPEHAIPGHTLPPIGKQETSSVLTDYRKAIDHIFRETIAGMNKGLTPDELVHSVKLPDDLASKDHLLEFYGNVEWGVRAIFDGYLGWFDGNPTSLFSLPPAEEARRMAQLAGGTDALSKAARAALKKGDAQWCAQLCDHLIALDPKAPEPKLLKAKALDVLADNLLTATGRNYYLTSAQELRAAAGK